MQRTLWPALLALALLTCVGSSAGAVSRIKDLANVEGIRQNQLIGYGLLVVAVVVAESEFTLVNSAS
jgi:flagellar P-ring protein precursor FlgI